MKIRPLFDRIVVQHIESSETTPFGLILQVQIKKNPKLPKLLQLEMVV